MRVKRWMQGVSMVYMLLLMGWIYTQQNVQQVKEQAPKSVYTNAIAYMADTQGEKPKIALTFDDGPSKVYTPMLLDGLRERGVTATFFLLGQNIDKGNNREIVKRMYEEGHLIGNHTYHHVEITKVDKEVAYNEIIQTNELIQGITGEAVQYMRPPFGLWRKELEGRIDVIPVMWSIDPLDWATENIEQIVNKVVTEAQENDIILLHDGYHSSVQAALRIVDVLQAEGYEFVTVDELIYK